MVDRIQHGKDRSFRKYINERKKSSESIVTDKMIIFHKLKMSTFLVFDSQE